jgi:hypothetical protein
VSTKYFLAKHVSDPFRGECRNIGVLVDDGSAQTGRFLGQSSPGPGLVDGRSIRGMFTDLETYRSWVKFWYDGAADIAKLSNARRAIDQFWIEPQPGELILGHELSGLDQTADYLFQTLVSESTKDMPTPLREAVNRVIANAGLDRMTNFKRDYPVESLVRADDQEPDLFTFPLAFKDASSLRVGQIVSLNQQYFINDALWKFSNIALEIGRIAIVKRGDDADQFRRSCRQLDKHAMVIDIDSKHAENDIVKAFTLAE